MMAPQTLYEKLWQSHLIREESPSTALLYIDRHLVHEVTSPQAFEGLRQAGRKVWRVEATLAVADHNVPTVNRRYGLSDPIARKQVETLAENAKQFGIPYFSMDDPRQGIVHVIGPEQGATLPGMTVVCGDSHTSTHGAFACLAFGIGTSEVEHVLATQTLWVQKMKTLRVWLKGVLPPLVTAKDIALGLIGKVGTAGGTGYAIEFAGPVSRALSMEGRMTLCNMAIEAGARSGMVAYDETTLHYLAGRPMAPTGEKAKDAAVYWASLFSDEGAVFDREVVFDVTDLPPQVTWGTSPEMVLPIGGVIPDPDKESNATKREGLKKALQYMGLRAGQLMVDIQLDKVFIGSCTNARIEDLREAAKIANGRQKAASVKVAMVVPGSGLVKAQAEAEGLDKIFLDAGFEWREPGCSMCLAMNADRLAPYERCASTSNRNFEGRQGAKGRTHLVSPAMAAAAAVAGHFVDIRVM